MADYIWVRSTVPQRPDGGNEIVLVETDTDHPGGSAFVAGPVPVPVAETSNVARLLRDGRLEKVAASDVPKAVKDNWKDTLGAEEPATAPEPTTTAVAAPETTPLNPLRTEPTPEPTRRGAR